jgi:hypothetical protein
VLKNHLTTSFHTSIPAQFLQPSKTPLKQKKINICAHITDKFFPLLFFRVDVGICTLQKKSRSGKEDVDISSI